MFIIALLSVGIVILQIFLSKADLKWPGLILPVISFIIALLFPLLNVMIPTDAETNRMIVDLIFFILLCNIPTVILLGIYFVCRDSRRRKKQLDIMNIHDLS